MIEEIYNNINKIDNEIYTLNQTIAGELNALQLKKQEMQKELNAKIAVLATEKLKGKKYGCGTANVDTPTLKIKCVVSKKIKWDEEKLKIVRQQIIDAGQDSTHWIKEKLSVFETVYNNFSEEIQQTFEPAREVTPSVPKITIERK